MLYACKTSETNDSDIGLFKKSEIIKIGSVEKKLWSPEVGENSGKSENLRKFIVLFDDFGSETSYDNVNCI